MIINSMISMDNFPIPDLKHQQVVQQDLGFKTDSDLSKLCMFDDFDQNVKFPTTWIQLWSAGFN